ncbi:hypothetical protein EDC96DRAFT_550533 [Choanephora cucurbitarum]|nr:hypothetical protein EDC96DRAFT_550533 [Choanephora cucurbitarum]
METEILITTIYSIVSRQLMNALFFLSITLFRDYFWDNESGFLTLLMHEVQDTKMFGSISIHQLVVYQWCRYELAYDLHVGCFLYGLGLSVLYFRLIGSSLMASISITRMNKCYKLSTSQKKLMISNIFQHHLHISKGFVFTNLGSFVNKIVNAYTLYDLIIPYLAF